MQLLATVKLKNGKLSWQGFGSTFYSVEKKAGLMELEKQTKLYSNDEETESVKNRLKFTKHGED